MTRAVCLVLFAVLSGIAGFFYYANTRQASALVATHDLKVGAQLQDSDVMIRHVNPSSLDTEVLRSSEQAVGQFVAFPVLKGQFLDARQVMPSRTADLFGSGLSVPAGFRVVGIPITPATAVGGALKPGDRVDVIAIPNPLKTIGAIDEVPATAQAIGRDVLVIGMRTDQGTPFDRTDPSALANGNKPSSILLAIAETDEGKYSSAMASSTFLLALSTD
jgi:Flp pilus assembly protein CpaB